MKTLIVTRPLATLVYEACKNANAIVDLHTSDRDFSRVVLEIANEVRPMLKQVCTAFFKLEHSTDIYRVRCAEVRLSDVIEWHARCYTIAATLAGYSQTLSARYASPVSDVLPPAHSHVYDRINALWTEFETCITALKITLCE